MADAPTTAAEMLAEVQRRTPDLQRECRRAVQNGRLRPEEASRRYRINEALLRRLTEMQAAEQRQENPTR